MSQEHFAGEQPAQSLPLSDVHGSSDQPASVDAAFSHQDVTTLLGLLAYAELSAQMRLAIDASRGSVGRYRLLQADLSDAAYQRMTQITEFITELGTDGRTQMLQFNNAFDEYEQRTKAETWHERVLKGYVGHAVAVDFCRVIVAALPAEIHARVQDSLDSTAEADAAALILDEATASDAVLKSRLALWGRRLVGEALNQIQSLVFAYPELERLVQASASVQGVEIAGSTQSETRQLTTSWLLSQLTADHARRMDRIGLAS